MNPESFSSTLTRQQKGHRRGRSEELTGAHRRRPDAGRKEKKAQEGLREREGGGQGERELQGKTPTLLDDALTHAGRGVPVRALRKHVRCDTHHLMAGL